MLLILLKLLNTLIQKPFISVLHIDEPFSSIVSGETKIPYVCDGEEESASSKMQARQARIAELDAGIKSGTGFNSQIGGLNNYASEEEVEAAKAERQKLIAEDEQFRAKYADQLRAEALARAGGGAAGGSGGGSTNVVDAKKSTKNISVGDKSLDDPNVGRHYMNKEAYGH